MPFRKSRSRRPATAVSIVTNSADAAGFHRALEAGRGDVTAANQIELIPEWPFRAGADFVDAATGEGREGICGSRFAGGSGRDDLAARVEHPAAANRRQRERQREVVAEHPRPQVARRRDRTARPEQHVLENTAVLAEGDLGIGAAVDIVEGYSREPRLGQPAEVSDVDDAWGVDVGCHGLKPGDCTPFERFRGCRNEAGWPDRLRSPGTRPTLMHCRCRVG